MSKKLYIIRHAEAEPSTNSDELKTLSARGKNECTIMRSYLEEHNIKPDLILYSTATRTEQTAQLLFPNKNTEPLKKLYLASQGELLSIINKVDNQYQSLAIIAHNPGVHQICLTLCNSITESAATNFTLGFVPASTATILLPIESWQEASPGTGTLESFQTPGSA